MSASSGGMGYGIRFTGVVLSLAFLSAFILYVAMAGKSGGRGDLFGDPFSQRNVAAATPDTTSRAPALSDTSTGSQAGGSVGDPADPVPVSAEPASPESDDPAPNAPTEVARAAAAGPRPHAASEPADPREDGRRAAAERHWADALRVYDRLLRERPEDRALAAERARVLSWSGAHSESADALLVLRPSAEQEPELVLELARNLFWAARFEEADDVLDPLARVRPGDVELDSLRSQIRRSAEPSAGTAALWLERRDTPIERLLLARALARSGRHAESLAHYRRALEPRAAGDSLALEYAAAAESADSLAVAASALMHYLTGAPDDHPMRLRLARAYHAGGAVDEARREYQRVIGETDSSDARAGLAQLETRTTTPSSRALQWAVRVDGFEDTEGFRWLGSRAARSWHSGDLRFELSVQQELWDAVRPTAGSDIGPGYGLGFAGEMPLADRWSVRAGAGVRTYGSGFDFAAWSLDLAHSGSEGSSLEIGYRREPSFRRAGTAAALQAQVASDITRVVGGRSFGAWHAWSQLELERLSSDLGKTMRGSGTAALRRELGDGWAAYATAGALAADGPSPVLSGWGPLYWAPSSFAAVAAGGAYRSALSPVWSLDLRLAPGYAWVDERDDTWARYAANRAATLTSALDATYVNGSWRASFGGEWNAAHRGYRASALRLGIHYAPVRP